VTRKHCFAKLTGSRTSNGTEGLSNTPATCQNQHFINQSAACTFYHHWLVRHQKMANHDELYNSVEPVFDGSFIRLTSSKDIVCPGTFVFFSELDVRGAVVGQVVG